VNLAEARTKLAAVLAPVDDADPDVLVSLVDTIEPPALMVGWGDPWLEPDTACLQTGRMVITCVAGRLSPGEGVARLEDLVAYTLGRLRADTGAWPLVSVSGPRVFVMAKTNYLAVRVTVRVTITS
jgi:hypothetical protein